MAPEALPLCCGEEAIEETASVTRYRPLKSPDPNEVDSNADYHRRPSQRSAERPEAQV
jgi:hypothetical protein